MCAIGGPDKAPVGDPRIAAAAREGRLCPSCETVSASANMETYPDRYWPKWIKESHFDAFTRRAVLEVWLLTGWGQKEIEPLVKRSVELAVEWPYTPGQIIQAIYQLWLCDNRQRPAELRDRVPEVLRLAAGTATGFFYAARAFTRMLSGSDWSA